MAELIEGILPLWKEKGMTSFDCVFKVRRLLGIKKVGHAGTLDPEVEGVLPIAVGKGTKVLEYMLEDDKVYKGEICLGYSTSTEDTTGEIIEQAEVDPRLTTKEVDEVLKKFEGEIEQIPPMFSAVRYKGKRLYEYAFEGIEVDRPSRTVETYSLRRTSPIRYNTEEKTARFSFEVHSSKGTYIRTLAVDVGKALGYPAHMSELTRIQSGKIHADQTLTLEEVEQAVNNGVIDEFMLALEYGLHNFPQYPITEELWLQVKNGRVFPIDEFSTRDYPVLLTYQDKAVAIYDRHPTKEGIIKPTKVFRTEM